MRVVLDNYFWKDATELNGQLNSSGKVDFQYTAATLQAANSIEFMYVFHARRLFAPLFNFLLVYMSLAQSPFSLD